MQECPVIFLAFANDHANYLYKLTEEEDAIREALENMETKGLCKLVIRTSTSLRKIWKTFDTYKDRIAIFHYGGHAEDYSLLLQKPNGEQQMVDGEGLVSFLARQRGLQLVFINGCCSKRQAEELRDKGVPAVIGTSEPINDEAATILSRIFYEGLAAGRSIEQAWLGAQDLLRSDKMKKKKGFHRGIKLENASGEFIKDFPWELYIRSGADKVREWNLPRAANNPLFGLDLPEAAFLRKPDAPYIGLHYFREEDAPIFYGRGAQIRELYNHLQGIHPIILLYGKSGVGKSSMLDAGLLPRIKDRYQITYVRRIQEKGLLGTLSLALDELLKTNSVEAEVKTETSKDQQKEALVILRKLVEKLKEGHFQQRIKGLLQELDREESEEMVQLTGVMHKWQLLENPPNKARNKPLVVILDQVEEKFTRLMGRAPQDELLTFLMAIKPLFTEKNSGIRGKLILSYRKEYHPEVRDAFRSLSLPYAELFLKRLDREGIIEAIRGCTQYDTIHNGKVVDYNTNYNPYRLTLEYGKDGSLPEIIADDLREDPESPIAPVLQIILQKLWQTAAKGEDDQPVKLSILQYQELRKKGTTMGEFFRQQMEKLSTGIENGQDQQKHQAILKAVESGLVLDLLHAHTTSMGTAGSCLQQDLLQRYEVEEQVIKTLLEKLINLSLLIKSHTPTRVTKLATNFTFLAHDTLAPVVILEYNLSDAPGQRAARILNNKMTDVGFSNSPALINKWKTYKEAKEIKEEEWLELAEQHIGLNKFLAVNEKIFDLEWLEEEKQAIMEQAQLYFGSRENEVLLEEADLAIVETGTGRKEGQFPGMRKLSRAENELVKISIAERNKRIKQEEKRQAKERRSERRLRLFSRGIAVAFVLAIGLAVVAFVQREKAVTAKNEALDAKKRTKFNLDLAEKYREMTDTVISKILVTNYDSLKQDIRFIRGYGMHPGCYDSFVSKKELNNYLSEWTSDKINENEVGNRDWFQWGRRRHYPIRVFAPGEYTVLNLQLLLVKTGFLRPESISGIFGYKTASALRQFQEYNRTKGRVEIIPDGLMGKNSLPLFLDWKEEDKKSDYNHFSDHMPSPQYDKWLGLLQEIKAYYSRKPNLIQQQINKLEKSDNTFKISDWETARNEIHLLCIRRNEAIYGKVSDLDDLFVLLIKGQVFIFWGSTDPLINNSGSSGKVYLAEGQHHFQMGWYPDAGYDQRAIIGRVGGVVVFRDQDNDGGLTEADILAGADIIPHTNFKISWAAGIVRDDSEGHVAIAGNSYMNYRGEIVNCSPFAAKSPFELRQSHQFTKTEGAYNSLLDLITILSDTPDPDIILTLINEKDLGLSDNIPNDYARQLLQQLRGANN